MGALRDVRRFLSQLKDEFPGLFPPPPRRRRRRKGVRRSMPAGEKKAAEAWFASRVGEWADYMEISFEKVRVRDMTSRWGSCTSKGNLSFNVRLLGAPGELIDYVIVHELAHRREMNHSPRFWAVVKKALPEYKELRKRLRTAGDELLVGSRPPLLPSSSAQTPASIGQLPLPLLR